AQITTEQLIEKNKAGAHFRTNKKRKVEGSIEGKEDKKMAKCKTEDPYKTSGRANKENENIIPQQAEQTNKINYT
ncbi:37025_t:CDS:1, partial [Gigaspora margarita]